MSELESGNDSDASIVSGTEGSDTGAGSKKKSAQKKTSSTTGGKGKGKGGGEKAKAKKGGGAGEEKGMEVDDPFISISK